MLKFSALRKLQLAETYKVLTICTAALLVAGCSSPALKKVDADNIPKPAETDQVVDQAAFQKGGALLIAPLKPGPGVPADDETSRMALMFVKGMTESVESGASALKVLSPDSAGEADFFLKGYITRASRARTGKGWWPGRKEIQLALEGSIIDTETERVIYHFTRTRTAKSGDEDFKTIAYELGKEVGRFVSRLR